MQKGFTLIQLAITFIIIGVLIGGVLAARGMIETAKIQRLGGDLMQYDAATTNFKKTYRYYPADAPQFVPAGNGDGEIGEGEGTCQGTALHWEQTQFFAHLSQAEMLEKTYVPYQPKDPCDGTQQGVYEDQFGVVAPYTELNETAGAIIGYRKSIFHVYGGGTSVSLYFSLNPSYVIPIETKFGAGTADTTISNPAGTGQCLNSKNHAVSCTAQDALDGSLYYVID
jgi:type II secretory pathway pseudopilin PulG